MKKLILIFFALFILVVATGCNARKNTVHFDPKIDELSESSENDNEESAEVISKGPEFSISTPIMTDGIMNTNINYHLIKGSTPRNTDYITVNEYKLTKYYSGQIEWSYIVSTTIGTLSEGENTYAIRAYDKDENEIGNKDFTITYEIAEIPVLPNVGLNSWLILMFSLMISSLFFGYKGLRKVFIKK